MCTVGDLIKKREQLLQDIQKSIDKANTELSSCQKVFGIIHKFDSTKDFSNSYNGITNKYKVKKSDVEGFNTLSSENRQWKIDALKIHKNSQKLLAHKATDKDKGAIEKLKNEYGSICREESRFFDDRPVGLYFAFLQNIFDDVCRLEADCNFCESFYQNPTVKTQKYTKKQYKSNVGTYKSNIGSIRNHTIFMTIVQEATNNQQNPFDSLQINWQSILKNIVDYQEFYDNCIQPVNDNVRKIVDEILYDKNQPQQAPNNQQTPPQQQTYIVGSASWLEAKVVSQSITDIVLNYAYRSSYDYQLGSYSKEYILYGNQNQPYKEDNSCWVIHIHWNNGHPNQNNQNKAVHAVGRAHIKRWDERKKKMSGLVIQEFILQNVANSLKTISNKNFPLGFNSLQWIQGKGNVIDSSKPEEFISCHSKQNGTLLPQDTGPLTKETHTDQSGQLVKI